MCGSIGMRTHTFAVHGSVGVRTSRLGCAYTTRSGRTVSWIFSATGWKPDGKGYVQLVHVNVGGVDIWKLRGFIPHCKALPTLYYKRREWSLVEGVAHFLVRRVYHLYLGFDKFSHSYFLRAFFFFFILFRLGFLFGYFFVFFPEWGSRVEAATLWRVGFCNVFCVRPPFALGAQELPGGASSERLGSVVAWV